MKNAYHVYRSTRPGFRVSVGYFRTEDAAHAAIQSDPRHPSARFTIHEVRETKIATVAPTQQ